jgi:hypothetical protein
MRNRFGEDIRILMLSANAGEFHRPETHPVHDQFLVKPVAFNQLIETIGGLLDLAWGVESEAVPARSAAVFGKRRKSCERFRRGRG